MIEITVRVGVNPYRIEKIELPAVPRRGDLVVVNDRCFKVKQVLWHPTGPSLHINHRKYKR